MSGQDPAQRGRTQRRIKGYCALCRSRCGCVSVVAEGRLVAVEPDPGHPTGAHLCAKGRAAPEIVHSERRLTHPLRRRAPKGADDPDWQRISWDEALDEIAQHMAEIARRDGPHALAFAVTTPSGTAISDHIDWIERLIRAYGASNTLYATELCNWHKDHAHAYTFGSGVGLPDFERAGCILLWGHNPPATWLAHATRIAEAKRRGAGLIVIDPRRAGLANKADIWLAPRPGTDGALALGLAHVLIAEGGYDAGFVKAESNGPYLVRDDDGTLLRGRDLGDEARPDALVAMTAGGALVLVGAGEPPRPDSGSFLLEGRFELPGARGPIACRPAFAHYAALARDFPPERVAGLCGLRAEEVTAAARLIAARRPLSYYHWTGVGQQANATQTDRAIALLSVLTGSRGRPGGNRVAPAVPSNPVAGRELVTPAQRARTLGHAERPLGPAADGWVTAADFCRAVETGAPYPIRGLFAFGSNLLRTQPDSARMARALRRLPFHVQADLVMTPTAALADIVLPVTSPWEHEALRLGFGGPQDGSEWVQLRQAAVAPPGEARSDSRIVFDLACRLGLGELFFDGDLERAWRHQLAPSGLSLEALRAHPGGLRVAVAAADPAVAPTPSGRMELYSETFLRHGQEPVPRYRPPAPETEPQAQTSEALPLRLTCAKQALFCHSQYRHVPSLRARMPDPQIELHPDTAAGLGIAGGDWVLVETAAGRMAARAKLNGHLRADLVVGQYGWEGAAGDGDAAPGFNYNALLAGGPIDPVSGAPSLRALACRLRRLETEADTAPLPRD